MTRGPLIRTPGLARLGLLVITGVLPFILGAAAHTGSAGGEVTEFAMPLWVVYFAGAFVIALSFALVGAFLSREEAQRERYRTQATPSAEAVGPTTRWTPLRAVALLVLALAVANVLFPNSASRLPAVILWLVLWVILPLIAYTVGDPWPRLSPFAPLLPLARRLRGARAERGYPRALGLWPAAVLLLLLIALEVGEFAWTEQANPLAWIILVYVLVTFAGMVRYGAAWLENAEVVGRMLTWWSALSPIRWENGRPRWRALAGLDRLPTARLDAVAFTIALLYGVNHDVFLHTPMGQTAFGTLQAWHIPLPSIALLMVGYLFFLGAWLIAARAMRESAESLATVRTTAGLFVASLLPIAAAYHLAHNLPYLVQNLGGLLIAASDPLGLGWNPTGIPWPESITLPTGLLGPLAGFQILLILLGHLLAVLVAHRLAFGHHPSRVQAVRAEIPLTLAMVLYTGIGLALLGARTGGIA